MRQLLRTTWFSYGAALVLGALALVLTQQTIFRERTPYLLPLLAVLWSARYGGLGPGLLATLLTGFAGYYSFASSSSAFFLGNSDDLIRLGAFILIALIACWLTAERQKSRLLADILANRQSLLALLAEGALANQDLSTLLATLAPLLCKSFNLERAAIMQLIPDSSSLVLIAGCGWQNGLVGQIVVQAGEESYERNSLLSQEVVVFSYSDKARTTRLPNFLVNHQVRSGMSVVIQGDSNAQPFGATSVYSTQSIRFGKEDIRFFKLFSTLLAKMIARMRSDQQLREKSEGLSRTLSSIADGVIVVDSQLAVTMINSAAQSLTGRSQAQSISQPLDDLLRLVDEKTEKPIENPAARAIRTGNISERETRGSLVRKDGTLISIDANAAPIHNEDGNLMGAVLTFRDTTVARQIEQATKQSEERLRVALKNSPVVVFNQDMDLRYTWVHNSTHGFPNQSVVGKTDSELMSSIDSGRWNETKRGVIESGIGTRVEISATVDGQRRSFDLTVEPLRDRDDRIVGITCASIDITERTRDQAVTSRLAAIVESSGDAIIGKTLDGIILSWNPGAERLYGYEPDEIIGRSEAILYPSDRMDEFHEITDQFKRGEPVPQHDTVRVRKDGSHIDVSVSLSLVRDSLGRVVGASTIARDITQRKALLEENARLVQELQNTNEELEKRVDRRTTQLRLANEKLQQEIGERRRANEQLRQLSAHLQSAREEERTRVAREIHDELGQVLTVVKMDLSLLEQGLSDRRTKQSGDDLATQIHATTQLVDDSIQKMRQIIRELRPGILDHLGLKSAIEWQAQEFQAHTGIECHIDASDEEIKLDLDRSTAVFRIFQETLTNIARHAHATQVDIRLEKNDHLMLQVHDNGRGIAQAEVSNEKTFGILGMRERALVFGGEVQVNGEQGKGTTITVQIPLEHNHD